MKNVKKSAGLSIFAMVGMSVSAQTVVFDNSSLTNGTSFQVVSGQEVGNEVTLGSGISLNSFEFEYVVPGLTLNPSVGVDIRFYLNDGSLAEGYPSPGTLFYDSGWYYNTLGGINPPGPPAGEGDLLYMNSDLYSSSLPGAVNMTAGSFLPSDFTLTITFTNLTGDIIDLPLANNSPGTNYGTYWIQDPGGAWNLETNSIGPVNFVDQFTSTVPEPSTFALAALGSVLLLGIKKLRRDN